MPALFRDFLCCRSLQKQYAFVGIWDRITVLQRGSDQICFVHISVKFCFRCANGLTNDSESTRSTTQDLGILQDHPILQTKSIGTFHQKSRPSPQQHAEPLL